MKAWKVAVGNDESVNIVPIITGEKRKAVSDSVAFSFYHQGV